MNKNTEDFLSSGHRDRTEIIAAIIAMTKKPSKETPIMKQVHLSHSQLKEHLQLMTRLNLIERHKRAKDTGKASCICQATEKGLKFLRIYCELLRLMYGKDYLKRDDNLAVACLQYCRELENRKPRP